MTGLATDLGVVTCINEARVKHAERWRVRLAGFTTGQKVQSSLV